MLATERDEMPQIDAFRGDRVENDNGLAAEKIPGCRPIRDRHVARAAAKSPYARGDPRGTLATLGRALERPTTVQ